MKKIEFIRWGDLSQQNHKEFIKENTFHSPPLKKGIYVFHSDWIEYFLVAWKDDFAKMKPKRFQYSGKIWTHLYYPDSAVSYFRQKGSWHETSTEWLPTLFKIDVKMMNKDINSRYKRLCPEWQWEQKAYKHTSYDHLELFIEKIN